MTDFRNHLRAIDPVAGDPYRPDAAALSARVLAAGPPRRVRLPLAFRAGWSLAAAGTAALTAGLVALLGVAPSLPVLAYGGPAVATPVFATVLGSAATHATPSSTWRPRDDGLGAGPSLGTAYQIQVTGPNLATTIELGAAFGVVGSIGAYNGAVFTETGADGSRLVYDALTPVPTWQYRAGASARLSVAELARLIARQRWDYAVAVPSRTGTATVEVRGEPSTLSLDVTVRGGRVVAASGPAFRVVATQDYPLASPSSALVRAVADTPPHGRATVSVTTARYALTPLVASGATWLLPAYRYRGFTATGTTWRGTAVALQPRYLVERR